MIEQTFQRTLVRILALLLIFAVALKAPLFAQEMGVVSFYSPSFPVGDQIKTSVSPRSIIPLRGKLFEGDHRVADFVPGRLLSIKVPVGVHVFSVGIRKPQSESSITLEVKTGENRCVRLTGKYTNVIVVPAGIFTGIVEEVSCKDAQIEAKNAKPIEPKHIAPDVLPMVDKSSF